MLIAIGIVTAFIAILLSTSQATARPLGMVGHSGNPATNEGQTCAKCHMGGTTPSVTISGPTSVAPGETVQYTLRMAGGPAQTGGFNVSTTAGTLSATGAGTQIFMDEATHDDPKPFSDGGDVSFTFSWTAPATAQSVSLFGAGMSSNADFETTGDGVGSASIRINVAATSGGGSGGGSGGDDCVIPPSGPWPPCATGGNAGGSQACPASGVWPPGCTPTNAGSGGGDCVIPPSGPWPPCATGGNNAGSGDCVIPPSGPWPQCARRLNPLLH